MQKPGLVYFCVVCMDMSAESAFPRAGGMMPVRGRVREWSVGGCCGGRLLQGGVSAS